MVATIQISVRVKKYPWEDFIADALGGAFTFYRFARQLYHFFATLNRFITSLIKKILVGVLIVEIVVIVLVFGVIAIIAGLGSLGVWSK